MNWLWNLVKSLKLATIVLFVAGWNLLCYLGMSLNGGAGRILTVPAAVAMTLTCTLLAVLSFVTAASPSWQRVALRSGADPNAARPGLIFIGCIAAFLALGFMFSAYGVARSHT
jgi:hypothetical protein